MDFDDLDHLAQQTRRLRRHQLELDKLTAVRDAEIARINEWFEDTSHGETLEVARLTNEIEQWALAHRTDKEKSWSTPSGRVQTRVKKGSTVVEDPSVFGEWCAANGLLLPPKPPAPDVTEVRDRAQIVDGALVIDGELVPGVRVDGAGEVSVSVSVTR